MRQTEKKITIVSIDNWQGLYIDGLLVAEDHRLKPSAILSTIGVPCEYIEADAEWLVELGNLPEKLEEVKHAGDA